MKQTIRYNTFETNSSSVHSLTLIDKETFEDFKKNKLFYDADTASFHKYDELPNLSAFKDECPDFDTLPKDVQEYKIKYFIENFFDTDYAAGYTYNYLDVESLPVYDEHGNEKVAFSIYIGDC